MKVDACEKESGNTYRKTIEYKKSGHSIIGNLLFHWLFGVHYIRYIVLI